MLKAAFFCRLFTVRKLNKKEFPYVFMSVVLTILVNQVVYQDSRLITRYFHHWNIALPIDYTFTLVPWTLVIYIGAYLIWTVFYGSVALLDDRSESERFFAAVNSAKIILLFCYLVFPTTADIRPEITGTTVWDSLYRTLYGIDPSDNYFPSLHCFASWMCFIGVRNKKQFPLWWKILAFVLAIAVFVSTITTRQHVIVDIFGGIALAELSYALSSIKAIPRTYTKVSTWIMVHVFRRQGLEG